MKLLKKIVLSLAIFAFLASIINWAYFYGTLNQASGVYFPTDFQSDLLGIRFVATVGLFSYSAGLVFDSIWGKILSLTSTILILSFYVLWYCEKFKWLNINDIKDGTAEYSMKISEIGWFRGANDIDHLVLLVSIGLLIWTSFRIRTNVA